LINYSLDIFILYIFTILYTIPPVHDSCSWNQ